MNPKLLENGANSRWWSEKKRRSSRDLVAFMCVTCNTMTKAGPGTRYKLPAWSSSSNIITEHLPYLPITTIFKLTNPPIPHPRIYPNPHRIFKSFKMDTLVAQYSKPMFEREYNQEDQMELYEQSIPSLSLRFAMPPVAHVCATPFCVSSRASKALCSLRRPYANHFLTSSLPLGFELPQTTTPTQTAPSRSHTVPPL